MSVLDENTRLKKEFFRTELTLPFLQNSSFAHLSSGVPLLRIFPCILSEWMDSTDDQRLNRVGDYFRLLNLCVKKQRKVRKFSL